MPEITAAGIATLYPVNETGFVLFFNAIIRFRRSQSFSHFPAATRTRTRRVSRAGFSFFNEILHARTHTRIHTHGPRRRARVLALPSATGVFNTRVTISAGLIVYRYAGAVTDIRFTLFVCSHKKFRHVPEAPSLGKKTVCGRMRIPTAINAVVTSSSSSPSTAAAGRRIDFCPAPPAMTGNESPVPSRPPPGLSGPSAAVTLPDRRRCRLGVRPTNGRNVSPGPVSCLGNRGRERV